MCAILITGFGTAAIIAYLWSRRWLFCLRILLCHAQPGSSSCRTNECLLKKVLQAVSVCEVGELFQFYIMIGCVCSLRHFSVHCFDFLNTLLGRCCFQKRLVGNMLQEQKHFLAANLVLKIRTGKMLLGHQVWLPVAEVKKYQIMLVINLSSSVLKPASLSSLLLLDVILKQSERKKTHL